MSAQHELPSPPSDAISSLTFSPRSRQLLVASWDRNVYLYDTEAGGRLIRTYEHRAPVLDVCWGETDEGAFSAGLDWQVKRLNLASSETKVLSIHSAGVRSVAFSSAHQLVISASWDQTLHIHNLANPSAPYTVVSLPQKPFSLSLSPSKLVLAMASRTNHIYDLSQLTRLSASSSSSEPQEIEPWQRRESSLKFMTRTVACMPDDQGYASSSIEGRVAVEYFDPDPAVQAKKYAFKCHRTQDPENPSVDVVYPVNALAFHPVHGSFASGGGDGLVALWDGLAKRRIRQYQKSSDSVAALSFSNDGRLLAVATCPGFEDGREDYTAEGKTKILIRELSETEAKGKARP